MKNKLISLVVLCLLVGCQTNPTNLYYWGNYQTNLYKYLQDKTASDEQVNLLEETIEQAKAKNQTPAPGIYAQLAISYLKLNKYDQAKQAFTQEKTLFPESEQAINFILEKFNTNE